MKKILELYNYDLDLHCRSAGEEEIRSLVFKGADLSAVRLEIVLAEESISYVDSSVWDIHSDLLDEAAKLAAGGNHSFEIEGYPYLNFIERGEDLTLRLLNRDGTNVEFSFDRTFLLQEVIECLRVTDTIMNAIRVIQSDSTQ